MKSLKGSKLFFREEMTEAVEAWFAGQDKIFFLRGLEALQVCYHKCFQVRGEYVD